MASKFSYYKIYKPYQMLSQFTPEPNKLSLKDLGFTFQKDVYPVGRLDYNSEGLLLLTNDNVLKTRLLEPKYAHQREYYVQVDGSITMDAIAQLENGVEIGGYKTKKAIVKKIEEPLLPERYPPIRYRKNIPTSWISLVLTEGKNHQVRKMTAKVGFPTLRLVRVRIENISIGSLQPGDVVELSQDEISTLKKVIYVR
jgi:23S rRNA pseudouridine2457 synthase